MNYDKIDLVMWTLNGEETLPFCLQSIEEAISSEVVNQKIVVDGNSIDNTKRICQSFGWKVYHAKVTGIPYQANQALNMVKTDLFASFEQDILLNPHWLPLIMRHFNDENVAVAQGVRVSTHPTLRKIEEYSLTKMLRYSSLDNTMYRTEIIKKLGGYNHQYPLSADRDLQDRILNRGYKWIVDRQLISDHLKTSVRDSAKKIYNDLVICKYTKDKVKFRIILSIFAFSPIRGLQTAIKTKCPEAILVYPYLRLQRVLAYFKCL